MKRTVAIALWSCGTSKNICYSLWFPRKPSYNVAICIFTFSKPFCFSLNIYVRSFTLGCV